MSAVVAKKRSARGRYSREEVLSDWKLGKYTERELAAKHKISPATAHNIVAGVPKSIEPLISKQIEINQELAELTEREVSKFKDEVSERMRHIEFFNHAAIRNVREALAMPCEDQMDFKARAETIAKGREVVLGKAPDTAVQINNAAPVTRIELVAPDVVRPD